MKKIAVIVSGLIVSSASCETGEQACSACDLTPDPGECFAAIPKLFFNRDAQQCEEFIWGGCAGIVPFETMEECEACACS